MWKIESIQPEPRMPHNINKNFTIKINPSCTVTDVFSQRPAFAKVRKFSSSPSGDGVNLSVTIHGMKAGTLNVPFTIKHTKGELSFVIRLIG